MADQRPVRGALHQLDNSSWILGGRMTITRRLTPSCEVPSWSDGEGGFFQISEATEHSHSTIDAISMDAPPVCDDTIPLIYDVGDAHAVWKCGNAYIKVMLLASHAVTREHGTLQALSTEMLSVSIPQVLYHGEWDGTYYLIVSQVLGVTLDKAWRTMNETARELCVSKVVQLCKELATLVFPSQGEKIAGIDGGHLSEYFLGRRLSKSWDQGWDLTPEYLLKTCQAVRMDCTLAFYHCDLGPSNILIRSEAGEMEVGVIDWECAGFVPRDWIRTKYIISGGMDFDMLEGSREARREWRDRMQLSLGQEGFSEVSENWYAWVSSGRPL